MTVHVRPADIEADRAIVLDLLFRNLPELDHARRHDWLRLRNPAGQAYAWIAVDGESDRAIGTASVFPRWLWLDGRPRLCGQVGDFAIDPSHRSLGPAVLLQKATFTPVDLGSLELCYDCPPHDQGMAMFKRLRMTENCRLDRYACPLRADRRLAARFGAGPLARLLARPANALLRLRLRRHAPRPPAGVGIELYSGSFDESFDDLDARVGNRLGVRWRRRAEDLRWRFRDDPLHDYIVLAARRGGELAGYAVVRTEGEDGRVIDLFAEPEASAGAGSVAAALAGAALERFRSTRAQTGHSVATRAPAVCDALTGAGFRKREPAARVVAYSRPGGPAETALRTAAWTFQQAELLA